MSIFTGDNMQLDLFKDADQEVKGFVEANSFHLTDEVVDFINERLTDIFNVANVSTYDVQCEIADTMMKQIGQNLQSNPEEWI